MATPNSSVALPAFAKLHGENFVYFMQKYSITLGRNTETSKVDLDLSELGGGRGPSVSRYHARIFYDFEKHHFALEVLGKNGCSIQDVAYLPGSDPVKLNSQDLIKIAGKQFYFLVARSFSATPAASGAHASLLPQAPSLILPGHPGNSYAGNYGRSNGENGMNRSRRFSGELHISNSYNINADPAGTHDNDTEDQQLLEEEIDAVASLVVLISDMCSPGEWVTMENLHLEILERFGESSLVRRYLTREDTSVSSTETEGRPWRSLLPLLRKHPEYFVMCTVTRGEVTSEYAALVSLVSLGNEP